MLSVKKELKIYRGTYEEINAQVTEDMTIYFAWDTQEIFVGNKYGVKTPYIGGQKLSERELRVLFSQLTAEELETLRSQILSTNIKAVSNESAIESLTLRVETVEGTNNDEIVSTVVAILTADGGVLEDYYNKIETDNVISTSLGNYYTKSQVDVKLPDPVLVPNFPNDYISLKTTVLSLQNADIAFDSIQILDNNIINESQLLSYIEDPLTVDGIYRFQSENGYELLNKSLLSITRISADGKIRLLTGSIWPEVLDQTSIRSINEITTSNGSISLNFNDILDSEGKVFNSLIPQDNDIINPLGRNISFEMGDGSVAFGSGSAAQGTNSIAIGLNSVSTGDNAVQLGTGSNEIANTLKFLDYQIVDQHGKIPTQRITERFEEATISIAFSDWNISKQTTKSIPGITETSIIWVSPLEVTLTDYVRSNIRAIEQANGLLTLKCDIIPPADVIVSVNVVWRS